MHTLALVQKNMGLLKMPEHTCPMHTYLYNTLFHFASLRLDEVIHTFSIQNYARSSKE